MSNVRSRIQIPSMSTIRLVLLWFAFLAMPLQAQQSASAPVVAKLFMAHPPAGWTVAQGEDIVLRPPNSAEAELVFVAECAASSPDCLSECTVAAARNYLYFFENNDPPAKRRSVARTDHLFEYRADGKFANSDVWVAASILCSGSGLVIFLAQSESPSLAASYLDVIVGSVAWQN